MSLSGKTAIVTGGGRDIGAACAIALAKRGANIVISYQASAKGAEATVEQIKQAGGSAIALQCDLTSADHVATLVGEAERTYGAVDILVNNAGGLVARKTIAEMDMDHWHAVMDLNLTSTVMMIKACLPLMRKGGAIINLSSLAGRDGGGPGAVAYATSKGAVMTMTRGLAKELGPDIRVNAVCPGMISTGFHDIFTPDEARAKVAASTPLKREGDPREIGELIAFLATDEAAFVNGACIDANGGVAFS
eukprot:g17382.t1